MNVAIVGTGWTALELIDILSKHPKFEIKYLSNSSGGQKLTDIYPNLKGVFDIDIEKTSIDDIVLTSSLVFLSVPHKTAMALVPKLLDGGLKVVDLSADYRLTLDRYEKNYCPHTDKKNLSNAVYGLPECYSDDIKKTNLIANPGCYPTATILGLLPFLSYIDDGSPIYIDAKSGISGAGKKVNSVTSFANIQENCFAYNPLTHRHICEIEQQLKIQSNKDFDINFVPHLIPVYRGMLISIFVKLNQTIDATKVLKEYYQEDKFIRIRENPPAIKDNIQTNFCDIFATTNGKYLYINTAIDNLSRGASSQAVLNANLMCGFDDSLGIV
ncbi:MAG: N-acetyl-gamma-glutamyl-phosphate reductase [Campylobacteraceae bacterium 4484_166]|nr:MAG: N-acetyl-gamma-glutamyl-phosphate reductase [Campylobacteraceae bacterium 4484_166]